MCERLIRTKVVELQSKLKQAAVALIKQMDMDYAAKVNDIQTAQRSLQTDLASARQMVDAARASADVDGMNSDTALKSVSSSLVSSLLRIRLRC